MLSAVIPSAGRQPAVPLAGQLAHESCVRPGPLVLGTAFLKFPTAVADRDRHSCYRLRSQIAGGQVISCSAWLYMSPCRSDHIFTDPCQIGVRHMASEDSGAIGRCTRRYRPPPFMVRALDFSASNPSGVRCSPAAIALTMASKVRNSA